MTTPAGATLEQMRDAAAAEAERLRIWRLAGDDPRVRVAESAFEGLVRIADALRRDPQLAKQVAANIAKWASS